MSAEPVQPNVAADPSQDSAAGSASEPRSAARRAFEADLRQASGSRATVLLEGESGSGKSRAARLLHDWSPRAHRPCVTVHLGAVSPSLIESELFGHEAGAFTDARRERQGCFRRAEGGTVVLDDIPLLPLESQVKLLRVLQERVVEPVGAEQAVPVDVRVVATSNLDLGAEVEAGRFREDLYYRLAVVRLGVPPLRACLDDLPELVPALGARVAARLGCPERPLSEGTLERLAAHAWPGNVRELENALERLTALGQGPIEPGELEFLDEAVSGVADELARRALAHGLDVAAMEWALIDASLAEQRGNVSGSARQLGLTRRALEYRLARRDEGAEGEAE
ncbi:MAG: sigma 54-interacting transcriptional regulator [Planctomycetota bacterium]